MSLSLIFVDLSLFNMQIVFLRHAMGTKDFPFSRTEALQNSFSFFCAQNRICIYGSHQNWRVLVVSSLLPCHAVHIHIDIPGERHVMPVIYQDRFPGQMAAFSLINLEMHFPEIEKADLLQRIDLFFLRIPQSLYFSGSGGW